ncbi:MAG: hypothetical protein ABR532_02590 [Candidatus Dormibacteria bacterium]
MTIKVTLGRDGQRTAPLSPAEQTAYDAAVAAAPAVEAATQTRRANAATLRQRALDAITGNLAYLALSPPSNAQVVAQVRALTQQQNALIRVVLGAFDATS